MKIKYLDHEVETQHHKDATEHDNNNVQTVLTAQIENHASEVCEVHQLCNK